MKPNKPKNSTVNNAKPKVFDVAKPGASAPNSTTRPLVVTHRPMVQDPMMVQAAGDEATPDVPESKQQVLPPQKIKIQPSPEAIQELAEQAAAEKVQQEQAETKKAAQPVSRPEPPASVEPTTPASDTGSDGLDALLADPDPSPKTSADSESTSDGSMVAAPEMAPDDSQTVKRDAAQEAQAPANIADSAAPQDDVEPPTSSASKNAAHDTPEQHTTEAEANRQATNANEELIDSKKYYVHIATPQRKKSIRLAVVGAIVIILVAAGCVDAMLDAGVLTISGVPHTHFIKQ